MKTTYDALLLQADSGNLQAKYKIGLWYAKGNKGLKKNEKTAVKYFFQAADKGYEKAQHALGVMYERGSGVDVDLDEAIVWYKRASEAGYVKASFRLGQIYSKKIDCMKETYRENIEEYQKECRRNKIKPDEINHYIRWLSSKEGLLLGEHYEEAIDGFQKAWANKDLKAKLPLRNMQYNSAMTFYNSSSHIRRDYKMGADLYFSAWKNGHKGGDLWYENSPLLEIAFIYMEHAYLPAGLDMTGIELLKKIKLDFPDEQISKACISSFAELDTGTLNPLSSIIQNTPITVFHLIDVDESDTIACQRHFADSNVRGWSIYPSTSSAMIANIPAGHSCILYPGVKVNEAFKKLGPLRAPFIVGVNKEMQEAIEMYRWDLYRNGPSVRHLKVERKSILKKKDPVKKKTLGKRTHSVAFQIQKLPF